MTIPHSMYRPIIWLPYLCHSASGSPCWWNGRWDGQHLSIAIERWPSMALDSIRWVSLNKLYFIFCTHATGSVTTQCEVLNLHWCCWTPCQAHADHTTLSEIYSVVSNILIHVITISSILFGVPGMVLTWGGQLMSQEWTWSIFSLYHKSIVIISVIHWLQACKRNKGTTPHNWKKIETCSQCHWARFFMERLRQDKMLAATTQTPNHD